MFPGRRALLERAALMLKRDVVYFGGKADGVTNNGPLIAKAISKLPSTGGAIYFPGASGRYLISTSFFVDRPVLFYGDGMNQSVIEMPSAKFKVQSSGVTFENMGFHGASSPQTAYFFALLTGTNYTNWRWHNCKFTNMSLKLQANGRTTILGSTTSLGTGLSGNCEVVGCEFTGSQADYILEVAGQSDTLVQRNYLHDAGLSNVQGELIKILDGSQGTKVLFNVGERGTRDFCDFYNSGRNTIIGNTARDMGVNGFEIKWSATDNAGQTALMGENFLQGNHAINCGTSGTGYGYNIDYHYQTVIGNVAVGCNTGGFRAAQSVDAGLTQTEHVSFIGNLAKGCTGFGFGFSKGNAFIINSNRALSNGTIGISLAAPTTNCVVVGNVALLNTSSNLSNLGTGNIVANNYAP